MCVFGFRELKMKKAQTGGSAGTLVAIITVLIILYILFLPPEDRNILLNITTSDNGTTPLSDSILLSENPGTLYDASYLDRYNNTHSLSDVVLYTKTDADTLKTENPFYVKHTLFSETQKSISLSISDLDNTNDMMMSFSAKEHFGRLIIMLNGNEIYNNEITEYNVEPIAIPKEYLVQGLNSIELSVSSPGIMFWRTNAYSILNFKIIGFITDVSNQESMNTFIVPATEKANLDKMRISFFVDCNTASSKIDVFANNVLIDSSTPSCGSARVKEFSKDLIIEGTNTIIFKTYGGSYTIYGIRVSPVFIRAEPYTRYFMLKQDKYIKVQAKQLKLNVTFEFSDTSDKTLDFSINGYKTRIETNERKYSKDIGLYALEGNNAIKVEPKGAVSILSITVELD